MITFIALPPEAKGNRREKSGKRERCRLVLDEEEQTRGTTEGEGGQRAHVEDAVHRQTYILPLVFRSCGGVSGQQSLAPGCTPRTLLNQPLS